MINSGKPQIRLTGFFRSCLEPQEASASKAKVDVATEYAQVVEAGR